MPQTVIATSGPLCGFPVLPVNFALLNEFKEKIFAAGVRYGFGAKDPHCGSGAVDFAEIDCSGFARTVLMYACGGAANDMPDGSYLQKEWFAQSGFKPSEAADTDRADNLLRVCIHVGDAMDPTGHIWLVMGHTPPHTLESYGGHGPGERPWNAHLSSGHTLLDLADYVYVLCEIA